MKRKTETSTNSKRTCRPRLSKRRSIVSKLVSLYIESHVERRKRRLRGSFPCRRLKSDIRSNGTSKRTSRTYQRRIRRSKLTAVRHRAVILAVYPHYCRAYLQTVRTTPGRRGVEPSCNEKSFLSVEDAVRQKVNRFLG